ncbi:transcription factor [Fusarium albosuccineum]|uniref:Transcription factor n=1 Tax=Fusarium albosuccineum TaxID=1237068 RepID=A0A8H4LDR7_9HYPO|nr:transcription factor [Fusarium albosuccineum]
MEQIRAGKTMSCKRCQFRKLRCSRTEPCDKCLQAQQTCEYRQDDRKRRPASRQYVTSLENRIASLEGLLMRIKQASPDEREQLLEDVSFDQWLDVSSSGYHVVSKTSTAESPATCQGKVDQPSGLQAGPQGFLIYHGPTSIYRIRTGGTPLSSFDNTSSEGQFDHVAQHFGIDLGDELVMVALRQFFRWQYPHFMFIYREAFLRDHFGQRDKSKYWSLPLLLSVCALGAVMSPDQTQAQMSEQFYAAAESIIIVSGLTHPSITAVQVFLCLAFYQIGKGDLSKGWELSGIAFRMAQDLGFQKDPKHWISSDVSLATAEDIEIRRRIYWGCYTSDKIISLILGRPVQLYDAAGEVEHTESLPDFPNMATWLPAGVNISRMIEPGSSNRSEGLITTFSQHVFLCKLIEKMLSTLLSRSSTANDLRRLSPSDDLELEFCRWQESLPDCIKWNRWEPPTTSLLPSVAAL